MIYRESGILFHSFSAKRTAISKLFIPYMNNALKYFELNSVYLCIEYSPIIIPNNIGILKDRIAYRRSAKTIQLISNLDYLIWSGSDEEDIISSYISGICRHESALLSSRNLSGDSILAFFEAARSFRIHIH